MKLSPLRRTASRLLVSLALCCAVLVLTRAHEASAHAGIAWASPAEFELVKTMPERLSFRFSETPVSVTAKFLPGGKPGTFLDVSRETSNAGVTFSVPLSGITPRIDGLVAILIVTKAADGHENGGVHSFYVGKKLSSNEIPKPGVTSVTHSPSQPADGEDSSPKESTRLVPGLVLGTAIALVLGSSFSFVVRRRRAKAAEAASAKKSRRSGDPRRRTRR